MAALLAVGVVAGDDDGDGELAGEQDSAGAGVDVELLQPVLRDDASRVEVQPDRDTDLLQEPDRSEIDPDVAGELIVRRGKEDQVRIFELRVQEIGVSADAAYQGKKIIGDDADLNDTPRI
jgi:hypothetical protein